MATYTAQQLIVAGLRRASMVDSPTAFIQHPASGGGEAFDYLNAALSELFDILYEADSEAYGETKVSFSTVAGTPTSVLQTLASNSFYHLRAVEWFNGSRYQNLPRVNFADRNNYPTSGQPRGYGIEGANLTLYPTPDAIYSMQFWFIGLPPTTSADTDTLDIQGPWSEFIWKHFAKACIDKEESDSSMIVADLYGTPSNPGGLAGRIRAAAKKRDAGAPVKPVDVQGDWDPFTRGFPWSNW